MLRHWHPERTPFQVGVHHIEFPHPPELPAGPLHQPLHSPHVVWKRLREEGKRLAEPASGHACIMNPLDVAIANQWKVANQGVEFGQQDGCGEDHRVTSLIRATKVVQTTIRHTPGKTSGDGTILSAMLHARPERPSA